MYEQTKWGVVVISRSYTRASKVFVAGFHIIVLVPSVFSLAAEIYLPFQYPMAGLADRTHKAYRCHLALRKTPRLM